MRGLILALAVFGTVLFPATMLTIQGTVYAANLPDSEAGLRWIIVLIMVPSVVTGIASGLTAGLGAYVARRMSATSTGTPAVGKALSLGAGIGGALGSTPFLLYLSWLYQNDPGLFIGLAGFTAVFGAYMGFTALRSAGGSPSTRPTA